MRNYDNYEINPTGGSHKIRTESRAIPGVLVFQERDFTWEQVVRVLQKNLWFGLLLAGGLTGLIILYAVTQRDFYRPTARIEISPPGSGIKTLHEIESSSESDNNQDYLETQVQILSSDALAVSVIRDLRLDKNPEFVSKHAVNESSTGAPQSVPSGPPSSETTILREQLDLATLTPAESVALERFRSNLSVSSLRNTRLIELSYSSHNPQLAQAIGNTLVREFIDQNYKHHYTTTMQASEWLSAQLNNLRKKVEESGQAVADYQRKYGLVEVDDRDVPMGQLMNEVTHQLSEAQAGRIEDEAFLRMIDQGHAESVPTLRDDKLYQDLQLRYSDLRAQLAQVKTVYGDANSNVKKLEDQVAEVSLQIDAERNRTIARTRASYTAAQDRERLMFRQRERIRSQMGHVSSQLTTFHMLKNEANANAELYNTLQGRLQEAGIYAGLGSSNIRVVDLASNLRKASGPHRMLLITLGGLGSCLFAVVLSFVRESFRNTVRTPDDIKAWTGLPSLALLSVLPAVSGEGKKPLGNGFIGDSAPLSAEDNSNGRAAIMKSASGESEAMRDLRTSLLHSKPGRRPGVILISSAMEGEGKTTVAINFAIALARLGSTCLLEADLRQPGVAQAFRVVPQGGLAEVLNGAMSLPVALMNVSGVEGLSVLPSGTLPASPSDVLASPQMSSVLHSLRQHFDYVVIDSPPVIHFSDSRFLSSLADTVVLVARYGVTTRRAMQRSVELLNEVQASVAGVVLNGIDLSSPDYNYYTYGYRRGSGRSGNSYQGKSAESGDQQRPQAMSAHA
jgi:capsular exopolysaccharide synthesis family protein